jgi:hypothetical protein
MSDRPTPETDSLERCQRKNWEASPPDPCFTLMEELGEMRDLARKLERELDEAREQIVKLQAELAQLKEGAQ